VRGNSSAPGFLLSLRTSDLTTRQVRPLVDPVTLQPASVSNNGTATPMVAPDDKVYFGVLENPFGSNAVRGWMLQFDANLVPAVARRRVRMGPHAVARAACCRGAGLHRDVAVSHHDQVQLLRGHRRERAEPDRGARSGATDGPVHAPR
jgi:hypothetical protein